MKRLMLMLCLLTPSLGLALEPLVSPAPEGATV